jgi:hypothetical protein
MIPAGSGFASKDSYLFGTIHMQIKLIPGDSAGTVTAYYVSAYHHHHHHHHGMLELPSMHRINEERSD